MFWNKTDQWDELLKFELPDFDISTGFIVKIPRGGPENNLPSLEEIRN